MNRNSSVLKLSLAGIFIALGVVCSAFSIPVGASRCFPVQHMVNVIAGVLLGPWYACAMAFVTSLIRVLLGTGTLLAFPGSMVGALVCGLVYRAAKNIPAACIGEMSGTGILGGMLAYPVATLLLGKEAALFTYVLPFLVSTVGGSIIAAVVLFCLNRAGVLGRMQEKL